MLPDNEPPNEILPISPKEASETCFASQCAGNECDELDGLERYSINCRCVEFSESPDPVFEKCSVVSTNAEIDQLDFHYIDKEKNLANIKVYFTDHASTAPDLTYHIQRDGKAVLGLQDCDPASKASQCLTFNIENFQRGVSSQLAVVASDGKTTLTPGKPKTLLVCDKGYVGRGETDINAATCVPCGRDTYKETDEHNIDHPLHKCEDCSRIGKNRVTLDVGSTSGEQDCVAQSGFFTNSTSKEIERCPAGFNCTSDGLTTESLPLLPGFWRPHPNSIRVVECDVGFCVGGVLTDLTPHSLTNSYKSICSNETQGIMCSICRKGFSVAFLDSRCSYCDMPRRQYDWNLNVGLIIVSCLLVVVVFAFALITASAAAKQFVREEEERRQALVREGEPSSALEWNAETSGEAAKEASKFLTQDFRENESVQFFSFSFSYRYFHVYQMFKKLLLGSTIILYPRGIAASFGILFFSQIFLVLSALIDPYRPIEPWSPPDKDKNQDKGKSNVTSPTSMAIPPNKVPQTLQQRAPLNINAQSTALEGDVSTTLDLEQEDEEDDNIAISDRSLLNSQHHQDDPGAARKPPTVPEKSSADYINDTKLLCTVCFGAASTSIIEAIATVWKSPKRSIIISFIQIMTLQLSSLGVGNAIVSSLSSLGALAQLDYAAAFRVRWFFRAVVCSCVLNCRALHTITHREAAARTLPSTMSSTGRVECTGLFSFCTLVFT